MIPNLFNFCYLIGFTKSIFQISKDEFLSKVI